MSTFKFVDYSQQEGSGIREIPVLSEQDVYRTLGRLQQQEPRFVDLVSPTGDCLTIGISGSLACVMFARASGDPPYLWALGDSGNGDEDIEFDAGGTPTPIPLRRCLPFQDVVKIVLHYFLDRELTQDVEWDAD